MALKQVKSLDGTKTDRHFEIYEVDGMRGTLKELSDYFNVDPVSVSDKLNEGLSISDALCVADPGFKPEEKAKLKKSGGRPNVGFDAEKLVADYLANAMNGMTYKDLADKYGISVWTVGKTIRKYKKDNSVKIPYYHKCQLKESSVVDNVDNSVDNSQMKPVEIDVAPHSDPVSTKALTSVQDLGDLLVITTTTTVVYRKGGDK